MSGSGGPAAGDIRYLRVEDIPGLELYQGVGVTRTVARHVHGVFSLSVAEAGVRISSSRRREYQLTPGAVFFSALGEAHDGVVPPGQSYSSRSLRMSPELLTRLLSELTGKDGSRLELADPLIHDGELAAMIRRLHALAAGTGPLLAKECLLQDIVALLTARHARQGQETAGIGDEDGPVRRVRDYLGDNCQENVSVGKLAETAGLSPFHLCRVFERAVGVPPHVYQLDMRLTRAAQLLARGEDIVDVALATGFCDQSHFHKAFKRKFGVTPGQYSR